MLCISYFQGPSQPLHLDDGHKSIQNSSLKLLNVYKVVFGQCRAFFPSIIHTLRHASVFPHAELRHRSPLLSLGCTFNSLEHP